MTVRRASGNLSSVRPQGYEFPVGLTGGNTGLTQVDTITTTPAPGNYSFPATIVTGTAEVLVVGGGGGRGQNLGGGGGAGGLVYHSSFPVTSAGQSVTCTIGSGGVAQPGEPGTSGTSTVFGSITALGGGFGGQNGNGGPGGSGGGASYYSGNGTPGSQGPSGGGTGYGNAGMPGTGFNPANGPGNYSLGGGGGGGSGGAAYPSPKAAPDVPYRSLVGGGGVGLAYSISGSPVYYSMGGSGMRQDNTAPIPNLSSDSYGIGGSPQADARGGAVIVKYYVNSYTIN